MKKFNKIFIPSIFIFFICLFITLLLWDIFKAKIAVSLDIKGVLWLGISVILLLIATFNLKFRNLRNLAIVLIIFTSVSLALLIQKLIVSQTSSPLNFSKSPNPLWDEYTKIAKTLNLNLNFTKEVWNERDPLDYTKHEIFKDEKSSVDILMFGDSSLARGILSLKS